ncbi:hypothetical protein [Brumicola pallidula]|jgi:hypothetical protein|uniref:hypothetical protein n=1 Tax=Brumicola pallidula TaxID=56807 RepID=UPI0011D27B11|nr:hypothetical protein [Glaciecola pallidula]
MKIRQGATTILGGNCGESPRDVAHFLTTLDNNGAALNVGLLGTLMRSKIIPPMPPPINTPQVLILLS